MHVLPRFFIAFILSIIRSPALFAQAAKSQTAVKPKPLPTLLAFDIVAEKGVDKSAASLLTELVMNHITELKMFTVVGQKDLEKMLFWEQNKQLKGCTDTSCLVQIAGAMGAQYYLEGSIGVLGDSYVFTLKLIDAMEVKVIRRATETIPKNETEAMNSAKRMVDVIMGVAPPQGGYPMNPYKLWGHVTFWSGLGIAAVGGVFTGLAYKASDDYNSSGDISAKDKVGPYNTAAAVMYATGGALMVTGVVLWILSPGDEAWAKQHKLSFGPLMDGRNTGLVVAGEW
jgi:TolB-like protein